MRVLIIGASGYLGGEIERPQAVIMRTSWITCDGRSGFERLVTDIAGGGGSGVLFTDDVKTPVHVADLAAASLELCTSNVTGVVHVAGTDVVSRYELGCLTAARDGLDPAALPAGSRAAAGMKPSVVRLDVTRAAGFLSTRLRGAREFTAGGLASTPEKLVQSALKALW